MLYVCVCSSVQRNWEYDAVHFLEVVHSAILACACWDVEVFVTWSGPAIAACLFVC